MRSELQVTLLGLRPHGDADHQIVLFAKVKQKGAQVRRRGVKEVVRHLSLIPSWLGGFISFVNVKTDGLRTYDRLFALSSSGGVGAYDDIICRGIVERTCFLEGFNRRPNSEKESLAYFGPDAGTEFRFASSGER
ncbi:hypothetical protein EVAR_45875_1 [Eumeta japonica]|uniref:Uncharacterized protein n=1 Tax=Eumeta variegata TaxID=151549 RepID=A0A4C1WPH6_EUMVA|nr:hypothetical protein EVAR_45875_1 [Eumeta japonica]